MAPGVSRSSEEEAGENGSLGWGLQPPGAGERARGEAGEAASTKLSPKARCSCLRGAPLCVLTFRPVAGDQAQLEKVRVCCASISFHPSLRDVFAGGDQGRNR